MSDPPAVPVPAATVVLLRPGPDGPEVLLTHRPSTMAFAAGMHVFPGGRVDAADADPSLAGRSARDAEAAAAALAANLAPAAALAVHMAGVRELLEEAGILLADAPPPAEELARRRALLLGGSSLGNALAGLDVRLATDRLVPIAQWTTPPFMSRRFATWFFVADLPPGAEATFVGGEVVAHRWLSPAAALDELAAGTIEMWIPTSSVLERLVELEPATAADVAGRLAFGPALPPEVVEEGPSIVRLAFGSAGAVPGRRGMTTLHGRRELVLVDPGDPSDAALGAIAAAVRRRAGAIRAIVLTRTDPDHAAAAEAVAIPLGIPILAAPGAGRALPYATRDVADGERLPADDEVRVRLGPPGSGRLEIVDGAPGGGGSDSAGE